MFIPLMHPCLMRGSRVLLGWSLAKQYQVDSVLPTVAPSILCFISEQVMSHGCTRYDAYEAGVLRTHCKTLGCLDGLDKSLLPEHAHRKMNKNHMCCDWQVGLPVQSKSSVMSHQWRMIGLDLESLQHQLQEILIWVGAHLIIKFINHKWNLIMNKVLVFALSL